MCVRNFDLDSFLIDTRDKFRIARNKIYSLMCPCMKQTKRKDSESDIVTSFVNPYYDPNYIHKNHELKEVVVIPNREIINTQPIFIENEATYFDINTDNNLDSNTDMESNQDYEFSSSGSSSCSDYEVPILYDSPNIYQNIFDENENISNENENENTFDENENENTSNENISNRICENENLRIREIVFKQIQNKRFKYNKFKYNKSLSNISESNSIYSDDSSEISEHIDPQEDSFMDRLEKNNTNISNSQISIRSEDINNKNDSSEDNWDVLSN